MTDKYSFKKKLVDRFSQNDTIPKPTFKSFNVPLYTGLNPGTKKDSISYNKGFIQGIKNVQRGKPKAFGLITDNFYNAGRIDGVNAMIAQKKKKPKQGR
jgi:hypothetical protein